MLQIKSFVFGPFQTNTYVVWNDQGHVLMIDPACSNEWEQKALLDYINSLIFPLSSFNIIATHGHLDHLWGAKWACDQWSTPVLMHEADIPMAQAMQAQYNMFGVARKAEPFEIQTLAPELIPLKPEIITTPGHTPGSVCLYFPDEHVLFSGDTLFCMGYGRTDLPGGNMGQLIQSLEKLFLLPSVTRVYPGHGDTTTIGAECR